MLQDMSQIPLARAWQTKVKDCLCYASRRTLILPGQQNSKILKPMPHNNLARVWDGNSLWKGLEMNKNVISTNHY